MAGPGPGVVSAWPRPRLAGFLLLLRAGMASRCLAVPLFHTTLVAALASRRRGGDR